MKTINLPRSLTSRLVALSLLILPTATLTTQVLAQTNSSPEQSQTTGREGYENTGLWGLLGLVGLAGLLRRKAEHPTGTYAAREPQPGVPRR